MHTTPTNCLGIPHQRSQPCLALPSPPAGRQHAAEHTKHTAADPCYLGDR